MNYTCPGPSVHRREARGEASPFRRASASAVAERTGINAPSHGTSGRPRWAMKHPAFSSQTRQIFLRRLCKAAMAPRSAPRTALTPRQPLSRRLDVLGRSPGMSATAIPGEQRNWMPVSCDLYQIDAGEAVRRSPHFPFPRRCGSASCRLDLSHAHPHHI